MKEYIIKVDEPSERVWDGSPKVFETRELVRCKDCKHGEKSPTFRYYPNLTWCNQLSMTHNDDWFCAGGERK